MPDPEQHRSADDATAVEEPPRTVGGTLLRLGPGLVIAGSIVGSGELIATTKTGAQTGMVLLWLILVGCVIKVFTQIEIGRYTISSGETALAALDRVPGPRWVVNWIVWYWVVMTVAVLAQGGGIVGGVGQAFALSLPLSGDYAQAIRDGVQTYTIDDKAWAAFATAVTVGLLVRGRYRLIQAVSTALVVSFTVITLGNVVSLQTTREWAISGADLLSGLRLQLPIGSDGEVGAGLLTALATFGIIGVGAAELIAYPYWCLEKGYARFTGPRSEDERWAARARGWVRVMHWDAFLSMAVYTVATLAFFVLGASVLHRLPEGAGDPEGMRMVATLAEAYVPVFGTYARWLFLIGAIAVLYSTFFVGSAGNARVTADALALFGLYDGANAAQRQRAIDILSALLPLLSLAVYLAGANPVTMVLLGGVTQAIMLPMLGGSALWFRYRRSDPRLRPGRTWDGLLWLSFAGLLVAGGGTALLQLASVLG